MSLVANDEMRRGLLKAMQRFLSSRKINIEEEDLMGSPAVVFHGLEVRTWDIVRVGAGGAISEVLIEPKVDKCRYKDSDQ